MKKINLLTMLLAAAAMAFTSCSKAEVSAEEPVISGETVVFHITAAAPQTKTVFGDKDGSAYPTTWTTNKQVKFAVLNTEEAIDTSNVTPSNISSSSATFEPSFTNPKASGTIYAFSPVGVYSKTPGDIVPGFTSFTKVVDENDAIYLNIPAEQTPLANSVDESAQALFASQEYSNGSTTASMRFQHIVAYGKMTIANFSGTIKSVELQFPENVVGPSCKYIYAEDSLASSSLNGTSITLDPTNVAGNTFWFALAPTAGTTGTMKIIITDNNDDTYTKTLDLTTKALPFTAGEVSAFTANFNGIAKDAKTVSLPWNWAGGTKNELMAVNGVSASGLGDDYVESHNPYRIKLDNTGDFIVIHTDSAIKGVNIDVKMIGGGSSSSLTVKGSADGTSYSNVQVLSISGNQNDILSLETTEDFDLSYRFVKIEFTKGSNVGVGPISITKQTGTPTCSTPVISYSNPTVTITCATAGATIYYTLDGKDPTSSPTAYSAPFDITETSTVKAIAVKTGFNDSAVVSKDCEYSAPTCSTPVISYSNPTVTITCATAGATIYYTLDGKDPTSSSTAYSAPFDITETSTVKAIAVKAECDDSAVASKECVYSLELKTKLTNEKIVAAGDGSDGYKSWNLTDENKFAYSAFAIKNKHSKATSSYHYLQIKKYASEIAYYIQLPTFPKKIKSIKMTVSGSSQPMTGGRNSATLYFSASNSTSAAGTGVASGTGASSITIDASSLGLYTGYITASGAIRIWDIEITYGD